MTDALRTTWKLSGFGDEIDPDPVIQGAVLSALGAGSIEVRSAWGADIVDLFTDGYALLRPHLEYLQVKDAVAATGTVVPAGEGDGQLRETLTALRDDGYAGYASLEPHLTETDALGGYSGPAEFGRAARAFRALTDEIGVELV